MGADYRARAQVGVQLVDITRPNLKMFRMTMAFPCQSVQDIPLSTEYVDTVS